jgi:crotonobetainyl-CoA dehydrogenase
MDFKLTEEQELLVKSITDLLQRECPESMQAEWDEKHEFPWKAWQMLADNGILALGVPEEYGGTPCDVQTLCLVCETRERRKRGAAAVHIVLAGLGQIHRALLS